MSERYIPLRLHHIKHFGKNSPDVDTDVWQTVGSARGQCSPVLVGKDLEGEIEYYKDVIGVLPDLSSTGLEFAPTQAEVNYMKNLKNALLKYKSLADDTPIALISNGKDWICGACVQGNHCITKTVWTKDEVQIAHRLKEAKQKFSIDGPFFITNDLEHDELCAVTTMGVLRSILNQTDDTTDLLYGIHDIDIEED